MRKWFFYLNNQKKLTQDLDEAIDYASDAEYQARKAKDFAVEANEMLLQMHADIAHK